MASEIRKLVLTPIGGKDPMLAVDSFRFNDGEFDLSKRTLKLPLVVTSTGSVRAEVDDAGKMNWQKIAEAAAAPGAVASPSPPPAKPVAAKRVRHASQKSPKKGPPPEVPPAEAPWRIGVDRLQIEKIGFRYADDSRWSPIQVDIANFGLSLHADLEAGGPQPKGIIDGMQSEVRQIVLRERQREAPLASLDAFIVNGGRIDLGKNAIGIDRLDLNGGAVAVERDEKGAIRLARVFAPKDEGKLRQVVREVETVAEAEGKPWQIALSQINLGGFRAGFSDRSVSPPASFEVRPVDFHLKDIANFGKTPISFNGKVRLVQGGDLSLQGQAAPSGERGQADIRLDRLNLVGLQPYVAQVGSLKLESGNVSTQMKVGFQQKSGKMNLVAKGEVGSAELLLKEAKTGKRFAAWDRLKIDGIDFSMAPDKLAIKEIHAIKPGANVEIFEDRTTNIDAIFAPKKAAAAAGPAPAAKTTAPPEKKVAGKPFPFSVQRVKVDEAILDFSDASLVLPFKTRIQNFGGTISGISNTPSSRTLLKLDGRVDEYGEANLEGTLDLMQHNAFSDVSLIFRNVEMSSLSPYSGTFAGRRIQSGKLNAELRYKIENSNLNSHGKIELDQLALGEEVVSPKAKSLPLDLAVALLTDNAGKITVSVPIEGNVNNPQFDYGSVIWDAIVTLITKAVTAPFTVLAGVFGSGDQDVGEIFFIPGKNGLPPAEIEKLKKVGSGLSTRPNVVLKVSGTFDPKLDAKALKSWDVRTQVTEKLGIGVAPGEDPGPVAFDNAKAQKALEDIAEERGGNDVVASALAAFRQQSGREPKRVGAMASWMDKASEDASFYQELFDQLVETAPLPPNALEALADRRSQAVLKELSVTKGLDRNRLRVEKAVSTSDKDGRIPTKLDLAAGGT